MVNPWNVIELPDHDVNGRRIDHTHPFDLFWAKDQLGHYLFIFEFPEQQNEGPRSILPDLIGIKTYYLPASNSTANDRLVLLLNEQQNWELFHSLCSDLVEATRQASSAQSAFQIILRRLARWHEFLKANRGGLLGEEKIRGLIGELLFLHRHLIPVFGAGPAVVFWQGPEGAQQDFCVGQCAIEVKCQSGGTRPSIRISSEFQLCSQMPELFLFVVTLGKASADMSGAINLPSLVAAIRRDLVSAPYEQNERFTDLLYSVGYIDSDHYLNYSYFVTDEKMYKISSGFPRICPVDLPSGVSDVSYAVSLSACEKFLDQPEWMEGK